MIRRCILQGGFMTLMIRHCNTQGGFMTLMIWRCILQEGFIVFCRVDTEITENYFVLIWIFVAKSKFRHLDRNVEIYLDRFSFAEHLRGLCVFWYGCKSNLLATDARIYTDELISLCFSVHLWLNRFRPPGRNVVERRDLSRGRFSFAEHFVVLRSVSLQSKWREL
jgi:hypothetical protein